MSQFLSNRLCTIQKYLEICEPDVKKLNVLRQLVGNKILEVDCLDWNESRLHGVEWGKLGDNFKELPITIQDQEGKIRG